jgi:putative pyruvate formate lyase activating enzyme
MAFTLNPYTACVLCPRMCAADRTGAKKGFCREGGEIRASCALLHFGEEPPITGEGGSGAVFFTGCTLQCGFCQNWQVSRDGIGAALTPPELAGIFLDLQYAGAENINVVTGTHFAPGILDAFALARGSGLSIPLVWNSSGYETLETVRLLAPHVRFFLPDLKTLDPRLSSRWFHASDYPECATQAVLAMAEAVPLIQNGDMPAQGVILRHLVLPGNLEDTRAVLEWFKENLDGRALISLMFQYTPIPSQKPEAPFDRMVDEREYKEAVGMLEELGIEDGYVQEPESDSEWLPDFSDQRPFPSGKSHVVWHYLGGRR